ncbi:hypothetical protein FR483_n394L [Paramecium bursaria Chlorella virus FR483]|uniref:Uncharacterized protein n394L n=1 Tax=Paramecium bursaria Chlorella virus FR483 TaxID=399781 RepID=A7J798_PBCVF|nr:hypothetical protein FR483_n394L [Paramecium bursaria Chlorella virus FR483]ABT15679.1 hypothetical protein FR483_n394L [Paramecium bursaria Chlorella virus FR483]
MSRFPAGGAYKLSKIIFLGCKVVFENRLMLSIFTPSGLAYTITLSSLIGMSLGSFWMICITLLITNIFYDTKKHITIFHGTT